MWYCTGSDGGITAAVVGAAIAGGVSVAQLEQLFQLLQHILLVGHHQ